MVNFFLFWKVKKKGLLVGGGGGAIKSHLTRGDSTVYNTLPSQARPFSTEKHLN
jgi:hypothetical protein